MAAHRGRVPPSMPLRPLISLLAAAIFGALASGLMSSRSSVVQQAATSTGRQCLNKALLPPKSRLELGALLEQEGFTTGAELGVQRGEFSKVLLDSWPSCKQFILVDLWKQQANYKEAANVEDAKQEQNYAQAQANVAQHKDKTHFYKMLTSEAASKVPDASLDFVYVDARHDYCGCAEDVQLWWPKVRPGGIMAGHDFLDAHEIKDYHPSEDWALCANGTINEGAVKGAVSDFAHQHGLTVAVVYREYEVNPYATWMVRKPAC